MKQYWTDILLLCYHIVNKFISIKIMQKAFCRVVSLSWEMDVNNFLMTFRPSKNISNVFVLQIYNLYMVDVYHLLFIVCLYTYFIYKYDCAHIVWTISCLTIFYRTNYNWLGLHISLNKKLITGVEFVWGDQLEPMGEVKHNIGFESLCSHKKTKSSLLEFS